MSTIVGVHREFSEVEAVSTPGGTATELIVDGGTLYVSRMIVQNLEIENVNADEISVYFIDRNLNLQLIKSVGPGIDWIGLQMNLASMWTQGVGLYVVTKRAGFAAEGTVRVNGWWA